MIVCDKDSIPLSKNKNKILNNLKYLQDISEVVVMLYSGTDLFSWVSSSCMLRSYPFYSSVDPTTGELQIYSSHHGRHSTRQIYIFLYLSYQYFPCFNRSGQENFKEPFVTSGMVYNQSMFKNITPDKFFLKGLICRKRLIIVCFTLRKKKCWL